MRIRNVTKGAELADSAFVASGLWTRFVGLLGRASLQRGEALVLKPCGSIHTAFMRFAIDVVYLDRSNRVVKVVRDLKPFRVSAGAWRSRSVLELPTGVLSETGTQAGDELVFESDT